MGILCLCYILARLTSPFEEESRGRRGQRGRVACMMSNE